MASHNFLIFKIHQENFADAQNRSILTHWKRFGESDVNLMFSDVVRMVCNIFVCCRFGAVVIFR
jgi:hypothetical protein